MASKADIQSNIDNIITGAGYTANQMRPLLTSMLDFSTANQTVVSNNLVANNTTSATSLVLSVGVNIIITSTLTDYACKLPQPITGQRVTVINASAQNIAVFPSNPGGRVNNLPIDAPLIIPPDKKVYDFICIENPLPGAWTVTPPATNQYDSGEISFTTTGNTNSHVIQFAAYGSTIYTAEMSLTSCSTTFVYDALNSFYINQYPSPPVGYPNTSPDVYTSSFRPSPAWNSITAIKIYTNIAPAPGSGIVPSLSVSFATARNIYEAGTNIYVNTNGMNTATSFFEPDLDQVIGINPEVIASLKPEIGEVGTAYKIFTVPTNSYAINDPSIVGDFLESTDGVEDTWFSRDIQLALIPRITGTVKFRVFIEYN